MAKQKNSEQASEEATEKEVIESANGVESEKVEAVEGATATKTEPSAAPPTDVVKACFDFNLELMTLYQTSDGCCFYHQEDAGNHAKKLANKQVKIHKR